MNSLNEHLPCSTIHIEPFFLRTLRRAFEPTSGDRRERHSRDLLAKHVSRVDVQSDKLTIELAAASDPRRTKGKAKSNTMCIPWQKPPSKRRREIIVPPSGAAGDPRPIRADARARLVAAIARGRSWLDELVTGSITDITDIAKRERCSSRKIGMMISLAFLAPDLVKAAIEGQLPRGMGIARLCDLPAGWAEQYQKLGLGNH